MVYRQPQITANGREELRKSAPRYLAGIQEHFTSLFTTKERAVLTALLQRVAERHAEGRTKKSQIGAGAATS